MVRSIKWIKSLTKVQNIIQFAYLPFIMLAIGLLTQCKSTLIYREGSLASLPGDSLRYTASFPKKDIKGILLYLPADPDSIEWKKSSLFQHFSKEGYIIFEPYKRYHGNLHDERNLDNADYRISDIINATRTFAKDHKIDLSDVCVFGTGEGSRLAVTSLQALPAKKIILLNFSWYGDLFDLRQYALKDSLTAADSVALSQLFIPANRLHEIVEYLQTDKTGNYHYGGYMANRWRSYNNINMHIIPKNPDASLYYYDFNNTPFPTTANEYVGMEQLKLLNRNIYKETLNMPEQKSEMLEAWSKKIWEDINRED